MVYFVKIRPSRCLIFVRGSLFFGLRNKKINQPNCNLITSLSNCSGPLKKKSQSELIFVESVTFYTLNREKFKTRVAARFGTPKMNLTLIERSSRQIPRSLLKKLFSDKIWEFFWLCAIKALSEQLNWKPICPVKKIKFSIFSWHTLC